MPSISPTMAACTCSSLLICLMGEYMLMSCAGERVLRPVREPGWAGASYRQPRMQHLFWRRWQPGGDCVRWQPVSDGVPYLASPAAHPTVPLLVAAAPAVCVSPFYSCEAALQERLDRCMLARVLGLCFQDGILVCPISCATSIAKSNEHHWECLETSKTLQGTSGFGCLELLRPFEMS